MYNLPYFKESDGNEVIAFMQEHPFAVITGVNNNHEPVATQLPFLLKQRDGKIFLQAHLMKQTDHHKAFAHNPNVLVVFTGASCYVSASWYSQQNQASTWNYKAVHAKGKIKFLDEATLLELLDEVTAYFENNSTSPSLYKNLAPDYVKKNVQAIVGIEVEITHLDHVFKLSQNKDAVSYQNIIEQLKNGNNDEQYIAHEMEKIKSTLF